MALFQSDLKDTVRRLSNKEFQTNEERDELLARIMTAENIRARDVAWMLFRPDRTFRDTGAKVLMRVRDPESFDVFLIESKGKPEAAIRAAVSSFFALNLPGIDQRAAQILAVPTKETKETREMQEAARRVLLEAPLSGAITPLIWQLAMQGWPEDRLPYLTKLAAGEMDDRVIARWRQIAADDEPTIREKGVQVLADRAPAAAVDILVKELPRVGYATQQSVVEALTRVATGRGVEFADKLLPLVASGDAATRTAVLKILANIGDPHEVVKRFILFSKSLAGFVRDRALDSLRAFGDQLIEPAIELLRDPDDDVRAAAIAVASAFDDPRIVPSTIALLKDPDWWIRIAAADTLGRLKDSRAVEPLMAALADPDVRWAAVESLGRIGDPRSLPALGKMLADPTPDVRIEVMQALRHFKHPQVQNALLQMAANDPERNVRARAIDILDEIAVSENKSQAQIDAVRKQALTVTGKSGDAKLNTLLIATRNQAGSDFHLSVGQPPILRISADLLRAQAEPFTPEQTEEMLREILTPAQWAALEKDHQLDFCYYIPQAGRYRGNVFYDQKGYNAVFRVIPEKPPTILELGLPPHLAEISDYHQGLVLVCGPSGSGKSTTLAALVNLFNETRADHVLMMEDPVEFVHPFKSCLVNQREVGSHTQSFARALRAALREDPDVIVIGELRDNESITLALTAAETGHIVLGTLNSTSAPKAIDRILSSFPADEQPQIRASLSESLKYCVAQRLLPAKEARKQVAAFEVLKGTSNIANMIRDEKTYQIYSAMQIGRSLGMQTFDEALKDLVRRDQITAETAYLAAQKKEDFEPMVSPAFIAGTKTV
ncbi:MAG TPA: PilT/PilU family type 4a pilus ATPase [Thermoanaerobaculia bacterium]|nr:PilT/PilU family type 4a pilus ATPase [Thermoanaerobaculia bacterium]